LPNVHKIHHSRQVNETNSNYANLLTVYDRLLRTYTPADRAASVTYGLDGADEMGRAAFPGLLVMPFRRHKSFDRDGKTTVVEAGLGG
jgi:sterol desaturase/sphingolipid hydroxylase (fatty acid hydroxylase superfamily)